MKIHPVIIAGSVSMGGLILMCVILQTSLPPGCGGPVSPEIEQEWKEKREIERLERQLKLQELKNKVQPEP